jgi:hypothetical protein
MPTLEAFRFFLEHAGYCDPPGRAACAMNLARAETRAKELGLTVTWEDDDLPWDGDCPAPKLLKCATVYAPGIDPSLVDARFPFFEGTPRDTDRYVPSGSRSGTYRMREVLASCGGIGLESRHDPYVRVVSAELFAEALDELDAERERAACEEAKALQARATYAGVSDGS